MKSNNLAKMIGKRVVQSCITILLVTLFVFALIQMVPGDPVANYLGATATEEQITYYRHLYGFDRPVIVQYLSWIGGLFGTVFVTCTIMLGPKLGAATMTAFMLLGQLAVSVILDHFALVGFPEHPASLLRLLGVAMLFGGAVLVRVF